MRSKLAVLTKKEILLYYGMRNPKKEPNPARFFLVLLIVGGMAPAFWVYLRLLKEMHQVFVMVNQIPAYFMSGFTVAQLFLLFTGVPAFLGRFYGNRDNPILLPMPIEPGDILLSRFVPVLLMQIVTALAFIVPLILTHTMQASIGVSGWVVAIAGTMAAIVFPTVISAAIVLLIMRYTNFGRHADKWKTIGILLMLLLLVGVQAVMQGYASQGMSENLLLELLTDNQALIRNSASIFVPARWAGLGIAQTGMMSWMYAGLNLAIAFLSGWFLHWLGTRVYLHSLLSGTEMSKEKKKTNTGQLRVRAKHPILRILSTEWKILVRTPAYAVNVLSTPLIVSVVWLIPLIMNRSLIAQLGSLGETLRRLELPVYGYVIGAVAAGAVLGMFLSLFVETSTSFSREGQAFWLRRILPVPPSYEVIGRSLLNILITAGTALVLLTGSYFLFRFPVWLIPIALLSAGFFCLPLTFTGLLIDVRRPKMDWDDPNQAVKQNLNSFFAMIASLLYLLLFAGIVYLLYRSIPDLIEMIQTGAVVLVIVNALLSVVLYFVLIRVMPGAMARME